MPTNFNIVNLNIFSCQNDTRKSLEAMNGPQMPIVYKRQNL